MQKVESWPQLQDAIKTSSHYKHCHNTNIISGTAECESLVAHTFIWLLVFLIQVILLQVVLIQVDSVKV